MSQVSVLDKVTATVEGVLDPMGFELVDIEYKREGRGWVLRLFIDCEGGVTLDNCVEASREVGAVLDIEDIIPTAYNLEVSSPGLDRPLKKEKDFDRFKGQLVKVVTTVKMDPDGRGHERKTFKGELLGLKDRKVEVLQRDKKGGVVAIPLDLVAKANLEWEF